MHLFGCKFGSERDGDTLPDRKNFDSLLWAIVTVFQVRTADKHPYFIHFLFLYKSSHQVGDSNADQQPCKLVTESPEYILNIIIELLLTVM